MFGEMFGQNRSQSSNQNCLRKPPEMAGRVTFWGKAKSLIDFMTSIRFTNNTKDKFEVVNNHVVQWEKDDA